MPHGRTWAAIAAILFTVALCYWGALRWGEGTNGSHFAYDDHELITGNEFLKGWMAGAPDTKGRPVDYVWEMLTADFATLALRFGPGQAFAINYYRPVIAVSYMVDTILWGEAPEWGKGALIERTSLDWIHLNPWGFHLTNVLFHAVNSLLVFLLARSLTRRYWAAVVAGVLFAAHPIHTESVTWIAGRTDVIATTFFLAAFWGYIRFRRTDSWRALVTAMALFVVGTFTKEMVATLPLLLVLFEIGRRPGAVTGGAAAAGGVEPAPLVKRLIPALSFFLLVIPYFLIKNAVTPDLPAGEPLDGGPWSDVSFWTILATVPKAFLWYLRKLVLPVDLNVYPMLSFTPVEAVTEWLFPAAVHLVLLGIGVVGFLALPRIRPLFFTLLALYVTLMPLNCLVPGLRLARFTVDIDFPVSERFLYIPSLFLVMGIGYGIACLVEKVRTTGWIVAVAFLGLSVLASERITGSRNRDWSINQTLFQASVRSSPRSIRMRLNHAAALMSDNWEVREARRNLEYGIALAREMGKGPGPVPLYTNLAKNLFLSGEFAEALNHQKMECRLIGGPPETRYNLAVRLSMYGMILGKPAYLAEALEQFQYAMQQDPGHPYVRESFGFSRNTFHVWNQYHASEKREDALVQGFASSFDMAAMSLENDPDAFNRLTALRILDSGLRRLPGAQELETLPGYRKVRSRMIQRIGRLHENLSSHYSRLLVKFPDRAALQFLMGEVNRIGGWWLERPALLDQARGLLEKVLAAEPEHAAAARSLAGILHHRKKTGEIMKWVRCTTEVLLREDRTWEDRPLPAQPTRAVDLVQGVAALTGEGDAWTSLVRETWLRALEVLERQALTRQDGNSWKAWNCLGVMEARASRVLNQQDLFEKSVAHLRKAHKIRPRARSALLNLMEVLERAGRYGEVRDLKKQLEALNQGRVPPPGGRVPGAGR